MHQERIDFDEPWFLSQGWPSGRFLVIDLATAQVLKEGTFAARGYLEGPFSSIDPTGPGLTEGQYHRNEKVGRWVNTQTRRVTDYGSLEAERLHTVQARTCADAKCQELMLASQADFDAACWTIPPVERKDYLLEYTPGGST
jgi:hypothetical protein